MLVNYECYRSVTGNDGAGSTENSNVPLPELHGTPSVSLRKGLLDKKHNSTAKHHVQVSSLFTMTSVSFYSCHFCNDNYDIIGLMIKNIPTAVQLILI